MPSIAAEIDVAELARHLSARIPKLAEKAKNTGAWTDAACEAFAEYKNRRLGWEIYPDLKAKKGEYLCDFMLFEQGYGARISLRVPVVA